MLSCFYLFYCMLKYNKINTWKNEDRNSKKKKNFNYKYIKYSKLVFTKTNCILPSSITLIYYLLKICRGVPQGSIHEPLFFNRRMMYADDTQTTLKETTSQQIIIIVITPLQTFFFNIN